MSTPVVRRFGALLCGLIVLAATAATYWPVVHASFVWDDFIFVHDAAWVRDKAGWLHGIFDSFSDAKNYFRPLGMAAFAIETRLFDASPRWMHLASLFLHLANSVLVGILAVRLLALRELPPSRSVVGVAVAMAIFALDPLLVEPVAWISNQFELIAAFFILCSLIAHLSIERSLLRALTVSLLFFLGACAKETAVAIPALLLVIDWLRTPRAAAAPAGLAIARREWRVYAGVLVAGIAYLALRRLSFGHFVSAAMTESVNMASRLQLISYTYLTYWKILLWPMQGLGPFHILTDARFERFTLTSLLTEFAALGLLAAGMWQLWKRRPLGALIVSVTAALFPVLHVLPVNFDDSYYHDRFATVPLAMACAYLPIVAVDLGQRFPHVWRFAMFATALAILWLSVAVANVRITLPLWSDEELLWQWVLRDNPHLPQAQANLLGLYIDQGKLPQARALAQRVNQDSRNCFNCMLNVAQLASIDKDASGLDQALQAARKAYESGAENYFPREIAHYIILTGDLRALRGDRADAEQAYRDAVATAPDIPATHITLGLALADQGRVAEANKEAEAGFALLPSEERQKNREAFQKQLEARRDHSQGGPGG